MTDPKTPNVVSPLAGGGKGYIHNPLLEGNEWNIDDTLAFVFRPAEVDIGIAVNDEEMTVVGQSHSYESYTNTRNVTVNFELYYHALMMGKESNGKSVVEMQMEIERHRAFLQALEYPGYTEEGVVGTVQPACLLCLPGLVTMRAKLKRIDEQHRDCDEEGGIIEVRVPVTFHEAPLGRITMEDVLLNGPFRTWG